MNRLIRRAGLSQTGQLFFSFGKPKKPAFASEQARRLAVSRKRQAVREQAMLYWRRFYSGSRYSSLSALQNRLEEVLVQIQAVKKSQIKRRLALGFQKTVLLELIRKFR